METPFFIMMFKQGDLWVIGLVLSTTLMLLIGLIITHVPLRFLNKIPPILYSVFLFPVFLLLLAFGMNMTEGINILAYAPADQVERFMARHIASGIYRNLALGLYCLLPFTLVFRSIMAVLEIAKSDDLRQGSRNILPSLMLGFWILVFTAILWMMDIAPFLSVLLIFGYALVTPFSSLLLHKEEGKSLALLSNYFMLLGSLTLFLVSYSYVLLDRFSELATVSFTERAGEFREMQKQLEDGAFLVTFILFFTFLNSLIYVGRTDKKIQWIFLLGFTTCIFLGAFLGAKENMDMMTLLVEIGLSKEEIR